MDRWMSIDEIFDEMRDREEEPFEQLRQRYVAGSEEIDREREQRITEGNYGRLPR